MRLGNAADLARVTGYSESHIREMSRFNGRGALQLPVIKQVRPGGGVNHMYDLDQCIALIASVPRGQKSRRKRAGHRLPDSKTLQQQIALI